MDCRVAVIGAGAAGLCCALAAAEKGGVLLLEGNDRPGRKLSATGNGRCNLTNLHISPARYHGDVGPARGFLADWPAGRVIDAFRRIGLLTRNDGEGRVYPNSLQAAAVTGALTAACGEAGVRAEYGFRVEDISRKKYGFLITANGGRTVSAKYCVLACGGRASPKHSAADGYALARRLGHSVTELSPSLAGLRIHGKFTRALKGMRCRARASLWRDSREVYGESGEVIFGDGSVSGICVMNLSARMRGLPADGLTLHLDLLESLTYRELTIYLEEFANAHPERPAGELFSGALNLRVGRELVKLLGFNCALGELGHGQIEKAAGLAKDLTLKVEGVLGWEHAQVTAGGVPLHEVDMLSMESRLCPGLYVCGELLDIDGDCGGFNLHWAWATGLAAGQHLG